MTPEGIVKQSIMDYLERVPGVWASLTPMHKPAARRRRGKNEKLLLDITGWWAINGVARFFSVEVKAEDGKRAPHQTELVREVLAAGGFACFAESAEEVHAKMRAFRLQVLASEGFK